MQILGSPSGDGVAHFLQNSNQKRVEDPKSETQEQCYIFSDLKQGVLASIKNFKKMEGSKMQKKPRQSYQFNNVLFFEFINSEAQVRHIYGPDSSGKTNFLQRILKTLPITFSSAMEYFAPQLSQKMRMGLDRPVISRRRPWRTLEFSAGSSS